MTDQPSNSSDSEQIATSESSENILTAVWEVLERQIAWEQRQEEFTNRQNELLERLTNSSSNGETNGEAHQNGQSHSANDPAAQQELSELIQKTRLQRKAIASEFKAERTKLQQAWEELRHERAKIRGGDTESQTVAAPVQFDSSAIDQRIAEIESQLSQRLESLQSALSHAHREQSRAEDELLELAERFRDIERRVDWLETQNKDLIASNDELKTKITANAKPTVEAKSDQDESALWESQKQALLMQYGEDADCYPIAPPETESDDQQESDAHLDPAAELKAQAQANKLPTNNEHQIPLDDEQIEEMRQQYSDKMRAAEIELSIERANIARERNQLEERLAHMERQMASRQKDLENHEKKQEEQPQKKSWGWLPFGKKKTRNITIDNVAKQREQHDSKTQAARQEQLESKELEDLDSQDEHAAHALHDQDQPNHSANGNEPGSINDTDDLDTCESALIDSDDTSENDKKRARRRKRKRK